MAKRKPEDKQSNRGHRSLREIMEARGYADRERRDKVGKTSITIRAPR